jgi:hypothetical protein
MEGPHRKLAQRVRLDFEDRLALDLDRADAIDVQLPIRGSGVG